MASYLEQIGQTQVADIESNSGEENDTNTLVSVISRNWFRSF